MVRISGLTLTVGHWSQESHLMSLNLDVLIFRTEIMVLPTTWYSYQGVNPGDVCKAFRTLPGKHTAHDKFHHYYN